MKTNFKIYTLILFLLFHISVFTQNTWTQLPIPDTLEPLFMNAEIQGYLYISSGYSSIFRSADYGLTWENISDSIPMSGPIAKINDSSLLVLGAINFYRSDNFGNDWYPIGSPGLISPHFIKCNSEEDIYIGYLGGLVRSLDGGNSWDTLISSTNSHAFSDIEFGDPGQMFIASSKHMGPPWGGFYRSLDNGLTIEHIGLVNTHVTAIEKTSDNTLYASTFNGLFKSIDLGTNWDLVSDTIYGHPLVITLGDTIYGGRHVNFGMPIYISDDLGFTWRDFSNGLNCYTARKLSASPEGYIYLRGDNSTSFFAIYSTFNPIVSLNPIQSSLNQIEIYPNPCNDYIEIKIPVVFRENDNTVEIFDLWGKLHYRYGLSKNSTIRINVSSIIDGTYLIVIRNSDTVTVQKIVKI